MTEIAEWLRANVPPDVDIDRPTLSRLVGELAQAEHLWRPFVRHDREARFYQQLYRDPNLDIWLICWVEGNQGGNQAVDEAFWVACFDKHYPEHFAEGLEPFSVCERWYFARSLPEVTHVEEIGDTFERKVLALCAQREMMRNTIQQSRLQLRTWGKRVDWLDASMDGDLRPLLATFLQEQAKAVAVQAGLDGETCLAEAFRLVRFGDLEPLFQMMAVPLDEPVERAPLRDGLDPAARRSGEAPEPARPVDSILPSNLDSRARLMGHHHLCAGAIDIWDMQENLQLILLILTSLSIT